MKSLQVLSKRRHYAVDKHVNPPMAFPAELKNQPSGTTPGFVNYFAGNLNEKIGRPMYQTNPSVIAHPTNEEEEVLFATIKKTLTEKPGWYTTFAKEINRFGLLRGWNPQNGSHGAADQYVMSGRRMNQAVRYPTMGAVVSYH